MDSKIEISEDRAADLDEKIQFLIENASEHPEIEVEYFVPDKLKEGGAYKTVKGCFKRVDDETHNVILMDGTVIPAEGLFSINGKIFEEMKYYSLFVRVAFVRLFFCNFCKNNLYN